MNDISSLVEGRPPTAKDIQPVQLPKIEKVSRSEFQKYVAIAKEYESMRSTSRRPSRDNVTGLDSIPQVFFEDNFQLDNPRVFDVVSEKQEGSAILQEKLTWYIDTVEVHLIDEISNASASFFSALDDMKDIRNRALDCINKIQVLREQLAVVDNKRALVGINESKLNQRRYNVGKLGQSLKQIALVLEKRDLAVQFYEQTKIVECLDTIDGIETVIRGGDYKWVDGWEYSIVDLRQVNGLTDLREELCTLRNKAGESYETVFAETLIKDLRAHYEAVPCSDTLERMAQAIRGGDRTKSLTDYTKIDAEFRKELEYAFEGLRRSDNVSAAFKTYRDLVVKEAKNVVRMNLPSNSDTNSASSSMTSSTMMVSDKSKALRNALVDMNPQQAEAMVRDIYTSLSELFRRLSIHQKLLLDIASSGWDANSALDLSEIVASVVRLSTQRMVKVLRARQQQVIAMNLQRFINYFMLNHLFLTECENICGETGDELRNMMTNQIKNFMQTMHRRSMAELQMSMEKDTWKEFGIGKSVQECVDRIVKSSERAPIEWSDMVKGFIKFDKPSPNPNNSNDDEDEPEKTVSVEETRFIVPKNATRVVEFAEDYLKFVNAMPHLGNEMATNLNELMVKFCNTVNELILQARAVRLDKPVLKHITAKHLSLASEALNLVVTLTPYMRECLRRHNSIMQSKLQDLDTTKRSMQQLQEEIRDKFVKLMNDRMDNHAKKISAIDWSAENSQVNQYMIDLCKDVSILVKIVHNILPNQTYLDITSRIFDIYKRRLLEQYTSIELHSDQAKERVLRDVEYFKEKLAHIDGAGNASEVVLENVKAMPVVT